MAWTVLCCLSLVSVSCGFHLRGAYELPPEMAVTYVKTSNSNSELVRNLKRTLGASDIRLVDSPRQAGAVLRVFGENHSRRVLSVDSRGRAREYELIYRVSFELTASGTDLHVEPQTLILEREFLFDPEDVLGKGREEATLISDMQQDVVRLLMLRLQAAGSEKCLPCSAE